MLILLLVVLILLLLIYLLYSMHGGPSLRIQFEREEQAIRDIRFYGYFKQACSVLIPGGLLLCGIVVSIGFSRRRAVFMAKIGESEFPVHYSQIRRGALAQQLTALVTAEELKQSNAGIDKAMALYVTLADMQVKALRAAPPAAVPAIIDAPATAAPSFADLLRSGDIAPGRPLIFGFSHGQPRCGTWQDIYSNATGGQSGQGKTATLRSLIAQSVLQSVFFWVIDWHYPHPKSLLTSLGSLRYSGLIDFADTDRPAQSILAEVADEIDRRKQTQTAGGVRVLCIDELFEVQALFPRTGETIQHIGTAGRKFDVFGMFSAQSWAAEKVGGTTARDNLTSIFAHKMKPKQGNLLLQDKALTRLCYGLSKGQIIFLPTDGEPEILTVPYCDPRDMEAVNEMVKARSIDRAEVKPVDLTKPAELTGIDRVNARIRNGEIKQKQLAEALEIDEGFLSKILRGVKPMPERIRQKMEAL